MFLFPYILPPNSVIQLDNNIEDILTEVQLPDHIKILSL